MNPPRVDHSDVVIPRRADVGPLFIAMAVLVLASTAALFYVGMTVIRANRDQVAGQQILESVQDTLSTLKDAETGQRGFLLTSDEAYLVPYTTARRQIDSDLAMLDKYAAQGVLAQGDVQYIRAKADAKMVELQKTVDLARSNRQDAALAEVKTNVGKQIMDDLRQRIGTINAQQHTRLASLRGDANSSEIFRTAAFFFIAAANLLFLFWAYRRVRTEIKQREQASADLMREKTLLGVTLASIGDAVIVTDVQGRITFLNHAAERLTGWAGEDAVGLPCTSVFKIINESNRQTVASPVDKVLQTGLIVGLANHSLLIRKDGSEIPIDDSGAPIRSPNQEIRGVVLVFRDFSEHKESERQLRRAKEEAEAANTAKDNFLATLSHELRTPLTPVLATLAAWESDHSVPDELIPTVQMLRRNVELEARLIDDLLDLTRIARGKLRLNLEVVDAHQLIGHVAEIYKSEILAKRLQLSMDLKAGKHFVEADAGRLQQVFWNILKNATKFTPEGGRIHVTSRDADGDKVQISIEDSGIGMDSETLQRIFRPFEQGDQPLVRQTGGLGLGMSISKALLEAQAGEIVGQSPGIGRGSAFVVTLPAVPAPANERPAPAASRAKPASRGVRILLVEDHVDTARVMARLLEIRGHQITVADSVESALRAAEAPFDLLLSDIGLTDGTGIELMHELRRRRGGADILSIALTGFGMEEDIQKCRDAGFTDHLTKPINFQMLEAAIERLSNAVPQTVS